MQTSSWADMDDIDRLFHKHGGWIRLQEELLRDTNRLWLRNHGRDDRCISDHGKEPRYPFLDENVVRTLSKIPLWEITDPRLDKRCWR